MGRRPRRGSACGAAVQGRDLGRLQSSMPAILTDDRRVSIDPRIGRSAWLGQQLMGVHQISDRHIVHAGQHRHFEIVAVHRGVQFGARRGIDQ